MDIGSSWVSITYIFNEKKDERYRKPLSLVSFHGGRKDRLLRGY